jgi:uncharacterized protein YaeQ
MYNSRDPSLEKQPVAYTMALKATVYKADLSISDLDRNYYHDHSLTLAQHPSETDERMMVRLIAFALNASERLEFGKGLSNEEEPALWLKSLSGEIESWIEVGHPEERRLRRACGVAEHVKVYCYGERGSDVWWKQNETAFARLKNLSVAVLQAPGIARLVQRTMRLQCTIEGGYVWLSSDGVQCEVIVNSWSSNRA